MNAEAFLYDSSFAARPKTLMMFFKRLREIDVPEMMAGIIHQTRGKPWEYYRDMSRQLWDEARHAMMGEAGFVAQGIDWQQARITHNWSLRLNTECTPLERHAVLYFIEQGLMTRTGKRYEWEVGTQSGDPLSAPSRTTIGLTRFCMPRLAGNGTYRKLASGRRLSITAIAAGRRS